MTRRALAIALGVLVAVAGAYTLGRYSAPASVEVRTEYVDRVREVRTVAIKRAVETKWRTVTVTKPDGSSTVVATGETRENENSTEVAETARTTEGATKSKTTAHRANWQVHIHAGVNVTTVLNNSRATGAVFGVSVGYRLVGPLRLQVGAYTNGLVTAGAGLEF